MKHLNLILSFIVVTLLSSCSSTSPREYFEKAALNSNLVTAYYTPNFFREIIELKNQNRLTVFRGQKQQPATAEEYLKDRLPDLSKNLSEIKSLEETGETKEMLVASVAYIEQADKIFKTDYLKIAKMIDANKPQREIQAAVEDIFSANDPEMFKKYDRLWKAAEIYADKNNIPMVKKP